MKRTNLAVAWLTGVFGRIEWSRNLVVALAMAAASSLVLLVYRTANPGEGAEHYFMRENRNAYRIMQVCYVIIIASIGFNLRYAALELLKGMLKKK